MLVKEISLPFANPLPGSAKAINKRSLFVYSSVNVTYKLKDFLGQEWQDTC